MTGSETLRSQQRRVTDAQYSAAKRLPEICHQTPCKPVVRIKMIVQEVWRRSDLESQGTYEALKSHGAQVMCDMGW